MASASGEPVSSGAGCFSTSWRSCVRKLGPSTGVCTERTGISIEDGPDSAGATAFGMFLLVLGRLSLRAGSAWSRSAVLSRGEAGEPVTDLRFLLGGACAWGSSARALSSAFHARSSSCDSGEWTAARFLRSSKVEAVSLKRFAPL